MNLKREKTNEVAEPQVTEEVIPQETSPVQPPKKVELETTPIKTEAPMDLGTDILYILNKDSNDISKIDLKEKREVARIPVGLHPFSAVLDGKRLYITLPDENQIKIMDTRVDTVVDDIKMESPADLIITLHKMYVANSDTNQVTMMDVISENGKIIQAGTFPYLIAKNPVKDELYVSNPASNDVSLISTRTNTLIKNIRTGQEPEGLAIDPTGTYLFVTNRAANTVSIFDVKTTTLQRTIPVGKYPVRVLFSQEGTKAYISNLNNNSLTVISTASLNKIKDIPLPLEPLDLALSKNGKLLYISNPIANKIIILDLETEQILGQIKTGDHPQKIIVA